MVFESTRIIIGFLVILIMMLFPSCDTCNDGKVSIKPYKLPIEYKKAFDSLEINWHNISSSKGRNDRINISRIQNEDGLRWEEKRESECYAEIGEVNTLYYKSLLYDFTLNISLKANREDVTLLYINPDYEGDHFRRIAVIDPIQFSDSGVCNYHYCLRNNGSQCVLVNRDWLVGEIGDTVVKSFYKFYPQIQIGAKSYKNCLELDFDYGKVTGPNAIKKVWFNLHQGLIKFVTQSNEEWLVEMN